MIPTVVLMQTCSMHIHLSRLTEISDVVQVLPKCCCKAMTGQCIYYLPYPTHGLKET